MSEGARQANASASSSELTWITDLLWSATLTSRSTPLVVNDIAPAEATPRD